MSIAATSSSTIRSASLTSAAGSVGPVRPGPAAAAAAHEPAAAAAAAAAAARRGPRCETAETRRAAWALLSVALIQHSPGLIRPITQQLEEFVAHTRLPTRPAKVASSTEPPTFAHQPHHAAASFV